MTYEQTRDNTGILCMYFQKLSLFLHKFAAKDPATVCQPAPGDVLNPGPARDRNVADLHQIQRVLGIFEAIFSIYLRVLGGKGTR